MKRINLIKNEIIGDSVLKELKGSRQYLIYVEHTKEDKSLYNTAFICHKDDIVVKYIIEDIIVDALVCIKEVYVDTRTNRVYDTLVYCPNDDYVYLA